MNATTKKHLGYYISLIAVLITGLISVIFVGPDREMRFMIISAMSGFSICWGVLHHYIHHDINPKIVLEYVLIGSVAIALAYLVLQ